MRFPGDRQQMYGIALVDDRSDVTGWESVGEHHGARDWDGYSLFAVSPSRCECELEYTQRGRPLSKITSQCKLEMYPVRFRQLMVYL